jgi:PKD repeat protein
MPIIKKSKFLQVFFILFCFSTNFSHGQTSINSISNLKFWFSGDSINILNNRVDTIFDKSGNGFHATQIVAARRPFVENNSLNSQPAILFETTTEIEIGNGFVLNSTQPYTFIGVVRNLGESSNRVSTFLQLVTTGTNPLNFNLPTNTQVASYGTFNIGSSGANPFARMRINSPLDNVDYNLFEVQYDGIQANNLTSFLIEKNNTTEPITASQGTTYLTGSVSKIGHINNATYRFNGEILELILFGKTLNNSEKAAVSDYIKSKYMPTLDLGADINIPYGLCDTVLKAGTGFKSYLWNTGATTSQITVNRPGTYWVEVKDAFGFVSRDSIEIIRPVYDVLNLPNLVNVCLGDSHIVNLNIPQDYNLLWNDLTTSPLKIITQAGANYYTLFDTLGCNIKSDTLVAEVDSFVVKLDLGNDTSLCAGNYIGLIEGSGLVNSFLWNNLVVDSELLIDTSGVYKLVATNQNNCVFEDSINVTVLGEAPHAIFSYDTVCFGNITTLEDSSFTSDGSNIITREWRKNGVFLGNSQQVTYTLANQNSVFSLKITTDSGCSSETSDTVFTNTAPTAMFNLYSDYCEGEEYQFIDNSISPNIISNRLWRYGNDIVGIDTAEVEITISSNNQNLVLEITDINGCSDTATAYLEKNAYYLCNTLNDIGDLKFWYNADSLKLINNRVDSLYDRSGNGYHAYQSSNAVRPTYQANLLNSKPGILFETTTELNIDNGFVLDATKPYTFIGIVNNLGASSQRISTFLQLVTTGTNPLNFNLPTNTQVASYGTFNTGSSGANPFARMRINSPLDNVDYNLFEVQYDGIQANNLTSFLIEKNNTTEPITASQGTTYIAGSVSKIGHINNATYRFNGEILELILFDKTLNNSEKAAVSDYIKSKYMPTLDLGADINIPYGLCDTVLKAGTGFKSYLWNTGATTSQITVNRPGTYWVEVKDAFGFVSRDSIEIIRPVYDVLNLPNLVNVCLGDSHIVNLNIPQGYNLLWNDLTTSPLKIITQAGANYYTLFDTLGCNIKSDTLVAEVDSFVVKLDLGNDTSLCAGNYIGLIEGSNLVNSFLWNNLVVDSELLIDTSGVYKLVATNQNNCVFEDSINVTVLGEAPHAIFSYDTVCFGNITTLEDSSFTSDGSNIITREWRKNGVFLGNSQQVTYTLANQNSVFSLKITTDSGCSSETSDTVFTNTAPTAMFNLYSDYCEGEEYQFIDNSISPNIISNRLWRYGNDIVGIDTAEVEITISSNNQNLVLEITDINGCSDTATAYLEKNAYYLCNTLNDIGDLKFWYNADSLKLINNRVDSLYDRSGNGYHAYQSSNAVRPTYQANLLNSKPGILFETTTELNIDNGFVLDATKPYTFIGIVNNLGASSQRISTFLQLVTTGTNPLNFNLPTNTQVASYGTFNTGSSGANPFARMRINSPLDNVDYNLFEVQYDGIQANNLTSFLIEKNNTTEPITASQGTTYIAGSVSKIGHINNATYRFNGEILELILFDKTLNNSEKAAVSDYIKSKYMPTLDLGADINIPYGLCDTVLKAGTGFKSYLWNTGATTSQITANLPGTYWVEVKDAFGFVSRDSIEIIRPNYHQIILNQSDSLICFGEAFNINQNILQGYNLMWNNGITDTILTINTQGEYFFTLNDTLGCSISSDTITVLVDSFAVKLNLGIDTSLCVGNEIYLLEGDSLVTNYLWLDGNTSNKSIVNNSGYYGLEATNLNGCQFNDSIFVTVIGSALTPEFVINNFCLNDTISFQNLTQPSNDIAFSKWVINSDTIFSNNFDTIFTSSGNYNISLFIESVNSCKSDTSSILNIKTPPHASFILSDICLNNPTTLVNNSISNTPIVSNTWYVNNQIVGTTSDLTYNFSNIGANVVKLEVANNEGCEEFYETIVNVNSVLPLSGAFSSISPNNDFYFEPNININFTWNNSSNALYYSFEIYSDPNLTQLIFSQNNIFGLSFNHSLNIIGKYYWIVKAFNACGDFVKSNVKTINIYSPFNNSNLSLWLKANQGLILDNNNRIVQWVDQSSNNYTFNQSVNISKPIQEQNSLNGYPAVRFNGSQFLNGGNVLNIGTSSRSMFIIGKSDNSSVTRSFFAKSILTSAFSRYAFYVSGANNTTFIIEENNSISRIVNFPFDNNNKYFLGSIINDRQNAENRVEFNNELKGNTPINSSLNLQSNFRFLIGAYNNANDNGETFHLNGNIAEIVFIDDASPQAILDIQNYLRYKYSPPINLGPDIYIDYGFCNTNIVADTRFVSYLWNTGATTSTITVNKPGEYWLEVLDIFGYTSRDTIRLVRPDYTVLALNNQTICVGDTTTVSANLISNYTIQWNNGSTDTTLIVTQPGDYFFTISDTLGCSINSDTAIISIDSISILASLGPDKTLCSGNLIGLTSGVNLAQTYVWNTGSNQSQIAVSSPFNYYVTVTSINGCTASDTIFIDIDGTAPVVDFLIPNEVCQYEPFFYDDLSTVPLPEFITQRLWDFGDGNSSITTNGNYAYQTNGVISGQLKVGTDVGCQDSLAFTIFVNPKPENDFVYENACSGKQVQFNGLNYSFNNIVQWDWNFGDPASGSQNTATGDVAHHTFTNSGFYNVELVTIDNFGCSDTVTKNIFIFPSPIASFESDFTCLGTLKEFNSTSFVLPTQTITSHNWNFGNGVSSNLINPSVLYSSVGIYNLRLEIETNIGCRDTLDTTITIFDSPTAQFQLDTACLNVPLVLQDQSVYLPGQPSSQIMWVVLQDTLLGNPRTYTFSDTLNYDITLQITDSVGCSSTQTQNVKVHQVPQANFTINPVMVVLNQTQNFVNLSVNDIENYIWKFGDGNISTDFEPSNVYTDTGEYTIWLIAENSFTCSDSISRKINAQPISLDIAVENIIVNELNGFYEIIVSLRNLGTSAIFTTELNIELPKGRRLVETWNGLINSGEMINYQLSTKISKGINLDEIDYICVNAYRPNNLDEIVVENNTFCLNLSNQKVNFAAPYPNPFNEKINVLFFIENAGNVNLSMFDNNGKIVKEIINEFLPKGFHQRIVSTEELNVGQYYLKINFNNEEQVTKKLIKN